MLAFLALLGAPYIYDISSLRVKPNILKIVTFTSELDLKAFVMGHL